uniref:PCIF1 WW domain-containing protein n=1 Tax=viral metagenome TaxID=1070528 RepID=A0A6C0CFG8_9ZZZZ
MISHTANLVVSLTIAEGIGAFRRTIGNEAVLTMKVDSDKVRRYFERAFVRWVFNAIRANKNPFTSPIEWDDFVSQKDIAYLLQRDPALNHIDISKLDWTWISTRFQTIHSVAHNLEAKDSPSRVEVKKDARHVTLRYVWSEDGWKRPLEYSLSLKHYENIKMLYQGPLNKFHDYLLITFARYAACGATNNHCSAPPDVIVFCGAKTELFGSPVNAVTQQYCSPFEDIEKYFGSLGSFFNFRISAGIYFMNPPYDEDLILSAMQKIIAVFKTTIPITVVMVIPMWDVSGQEKYRGRVHIVKEYEALELIEKSGFIRSKTVLGYQSHLFFDYYTDCYKVIADTYLIVASNTDYQISALEISTKWLEVTN